MKPPLIRLVAAIAAACPSFLCAAAAGGDPFDQPDPFVLATAAMARGDLVAADTLAAPLVAGHPTPELCTLMGEIRLGQKRSNEAIAFFDQATRLGPQDPILFSRLGTVLVQTLGEAPESERAALAGRALAALLRSVELDPDHYDGNVALANFYAQVPPALGGDVAKAPPYAQRIQKVNGFHGAVLFGMIAESQGKLEAALERYLEAIKMWNGQEDVRACEARVLARLGRAAEARACWEKIAADFPDWAPARQALAALPAGPAPAK